MSAHTQSTRSHEAIREWAEHRDGHPATVKGTTGGDEAGLLRIDFGQPEERLERITWDQFFRKFDEQDLEFLYQDKLDSGDVSRFCKFIRKAK